MVIVVVYEFNFAYLFINYLRRNTHPNVRDCQMAAELPSDPSTPSQ